MNDQNDQSPKQGIVRLILALAGVAALSLGAFMAWRSAHTAAGPRVVLVGMDALTWDLMDPLLAEGRLPNFQSLIDRGTHGQLKTMRSTYISASIWTTILTGKHPKQHGVKGFFTTRGFPVNSSHRQSKYLPQILGEQGVTVASVGFMATWPAEEVNGWMVSDLASYGRFKDSSEGMNQSVHDYSYLKKLEQVTWPPELIDELLPVMLAPEDVPREVYERVLPMTDEQWEEFQRIDRISRDDVLGLLKFSIVTDYNFHRAGLEIIRRHGPEAYMVYFQGPDIMEHFFWKYMDPGDFPSVTQDEVARFGQVIPDYYVFMDGLLGEILEASSPDPLVLVCSDHGQKKVRFMGQDGPHSGEHRLSKPAGIVVMAGPGVRSIPDKKLKGMVVYDVVPTLLYLLGLPLGQDMTHGKIFLGGIEEGYVEANQIRFIPTYDSGAGAKEEVFSPLDEQIKERLRALGYVE